MKTKTEIINSDIVDDCRRPLLDMVVNGHETMNMVLLSSGPGGVSIHAAIPGSTSKEEGEKEMKLMVQTWHRLLFPEVYN